MSQILLNSSISLPDVYSGGPLRIDCTQNWGRFGSINLDDPQSAPYIDLGRDVTQFQGQRIHWQSATSHKDDEGKVFRFVIDLFNLITTSGIIDVYRKAIEHQEFFPHSVAESPRLLPACGFDLQSPDLLSKFNILAERWERERPDWSNITEMSLHPAYQQIIGMGQPAVPFILEKLKEKPDHWFWALHSISGDNPVSVESEGDIEQMAKAWIRWGTERGYISSMD